MEIDAEGVFVVFLMIAFAIILLVIGKLGGPVSWYIFGNTGLLILIAVTLGLVAVALSILLEE